MNPRPSSPKNRHKNRHKPLKMNPERPKVRKTIVANTACTEALKMPGFMSYGAAVASQQALGAASLTFSV